MADLVITRAEVDGRERDVHLAGDRIARIGDRLRPPRGAEVLDAAGGALLPGLHDHHVHLAAAAAALESVEVGPPTVTDRRQLAEALRAAYRALADGAWLRAVGYHESVAGAIGRAELDGLVPDRPLRIQHRSGALWVLNSRALDSLGVADAGEDGFERGPDGRPTGRLFRLDDWLGDRIGRTTPGLGRVSLAAARAGVTGFTDATPVRGCEPLRSIAADAGLLQRTTVMTAPDVALGCPEPLALGPVKVILDDVALPGLEELAGVMARAHGSGRAVAVHCVTAVQIVLAVAALEESGSQAGDRIEHGSVIPAGLIPRLRRLGTTVVTNPGFLHARGDRYSVDVEAAERPDLYRCGSLRSGGVGVAAGTDAPFGPSDPWLSVRAAVTRSSASGAILSPSERVAAGVALSLFLGSAEDPATPRRVERGAPADLCVLRVPLSEALRSPSADNVATTVIAGSVVVDDR